MKFIHARLKFIHAQPSKIGQMTPKLKFRLVSHATPQHNRCFDGDYNHEAQTNGIIV
jgi:hypothetical protein